MWGGGGGDAPSRSSESNNRKGTERVAVIEGVNADGCRWCRLQRRIASRPYIVRGDAVTPTGYSVLSRAIQHCPLFEVIPATDFVLVHYFNW
jgi:hypothetical protein